MQHYSVVTKDGSFMVVDNLDKVSLKRLSHTFKWKRFTRVGDTLFASDQILFISKEGQNVRKEDSLATTYMRSRESLKRRSTDTPKKSTLDGFKESVEDCGFFVTVGKRSVYIYESDNTDLKRQALAIVPLDIPSFDFFGTTITAERRTLLELILSFVKNR